MIRYNQGFGKFGPMEQSNDGEWVKFEDADEIITNLRNFNADLIESNSSDYKFYSKVSNDMNQLCTNQTIVIIGLSIVLAYSLYLNFGGIA